MSKECSSTLRSNTNSDSDRLKATNILAAIATLVVANNADYTHRNFQLNWQIDSNRLEKHQTNFTR